MVRLRTLRQRRHRAQKGQVSAVATILGLLLVVGFIANYVVTTLPQQEIQIEFDHILEVENQLGRLQATILKEAQQPRIPVALATPVTLGSDANPPFGGISSGSLQGETQSSHILASYTIENVFPNLPDWNTGSPCLNGGSGKCTTNGATFFWNVTGQDNTTFTITVNSNNNNLVYNISANYDTVNIDWTGGDTGFVLVNLNGSHDIVNYNKGGSDSNSPFVQFYFFGQNDQFNFAPSGSHSGKGGMTLFVEFVGTRNQLCPYGNLSSSDTVGTLSAGGSDLNVTIQWWNDVGYVSAPHTVPYPGGGSNETLTFQNKTGFVNCAFTIAYTHTYTAEYLAGFKVHLYNRYLPQTDVVYDQGAVIESQEDGGSLMVSPPPVTEFARPFGLEVAITLVNLVGNITSIDGAATAGITTQVVAEHTYHVSNENLTQTNTFFAAPLYLNVTTAYPEAWATWMLSLPHVFPGGPICTSSVTFAKPYSCLSPPPGTTVTLVGPLLASELTINAITARVGIT